MYSPNILVVEDEDRLRELIIKYLVREGYNVFGAENGKVALDTFEEKCIDLIILDVFMPYINGWEVCRQVRINSDVPIIMLTARADEGDKVYGFELGVDQYVTKPFSTKELVARVKSLLKKKIKTASEIINIYGLMINTVSRQVIINEKEIELCPKEYDLLLYFIDNKNVALSRQMILDRIWGYDYFGDARTVDTHIKRLRQKICKYGELITTVRGLGYRFEVKK